MKSLRFTTCMLSTVVYQSTIGCMLAERSTKWANSAGAMGFWSRVRDASTLSMGDLLECLSLRRQALEQQPACGPCRHMARRSRRPYWKKHRKQTCGNEAIFRSLRRGRVELD